MGIGFATSYKKGKDVTAWINSCIDKISNLFSKKRVTTYKKPETDYDYNKRKNDQMKDIDCILDKIKKSGYNSLTENEKKTLFNVNK